MAKSEQKHTAAEMQGLYGPFTVAERVVQKIWLQQDFVSVRAQLTDGRRLEVLSPGRWNLLGGPDFRRARLRIDGREVEGDIEVHFHAGDWKAHNHAANPAYANVVLHVLMFPPDVRARFQRRADGAEIPSFVLLPLLHRDLEEYAADDALEAITARDDWRRIEELANLPFDEVREQLRRRAQSRWERKVAYARLRIARLGREAAAHQTALEILGYRQNRVPMLAAAERWPLPAWRGGLVPIEVLRSVNGWQRQGLRPANRPVTRLFQYRDWVAAVPDWPERLAAWAGGMAALETSVDSGSNPFRRAAGLATMRDQLWKLTGRVVGGPRLNTLVCDGLLPLGAAEAARPDFGAVWFHWFPGDMPEQIRQALPKLGVTGARDQPLCHGFAQGLLAWLIEREICA
ncbi:MAG: DUF2851 domain-containing protein [Opitutus sp.]|nr:DUF2851 domain-containing protein [Opitutus sp.]